MTRPALLDGFLATLPRVTARALAKDIENCVAIEAARARNELHEANEHLMAAREALEMREEEP